MKVDHVVRYKGTIICGVVDFDIKPNDEIDIITSEGTTSARVWAIEGVFGKLVEEAKIGQSVAMMVRGISHVPIEPGDIVTKKII